MAATIRGVASIRINTVAVEMEHEYVVADVKEVCGLEENEDVWITWSQRRVMIVWRSGRRCCTGGGGMYVGGSM